MKDHEVLRLEMIEAFGAFNSMDPLRLAQRKALWEDYVSAREEFLKSDCAKKHMKYIPLHMTLIDSQHYAN